MKGAMTPGKPSAESTPPGRSHPVSGWQADDDDPKPYRVASLGHRTVRRLSALRPVSWAMARVLPHIDRPVSQLTGGRHTLASLLSGMTVAELTTTGSRSGRPRMVRVLGLAVGDGFVVIASNFGKAQHPGWYYNLLAHPRAKLLVHGRSRIVVAELTTGQRRAQLWECGLRFYPGWRHYQARQEDREIGVFLLTEAP
jgi:deazaflavin-dependent oxidoreductase (nitroreductase family)